MWSFHYRFFPPFYTNAGGTGGPGCGIQPPNKSTWGGYHDIICHDQQAMYMASFQQWVAYLHLILRPSMFFSGKTWYGKIGLEFNKESQTWGIAQYKKFLICLKSCYPDPQDFKKLRYVLQHLYWPISNNPLSSFDQMEILFSQISEETSQ